MAFRKRRKTLTLARGKRKMARLNKGERTRMILQVISESPEGSNLYDQLEALGYSRRQAWGYIPRLLSWGYVKRTKPGQYVLTSKGENVLRRLTLGQVHCPLCGGLARRNGTRNGRQRWRCVKCGFHFTSGSEETLVKSLKKRKKAVFLLICDQWEESKLYFLLKDWLSERQLHREVKSVRFIEV